MSCFCVCRRRQILDGDLQRDRLLVAFDRFFGVLVGEPHKHNHQDCSWKWKLNINAMPTPPIRCVKNANKVKNYGSVVHFFVPYMSFKTAGVFILTFPPSSYLWLQRCQAGYPLQTGSSACPATAWQAFCSFLSRCKDTRSLRRGGRKGCTQASLFKVFKVLPRKQKLQHGDKSCFD